MNGAAKKEKVEARIHELYERDGILTTSAVLKDAKKKSSPLHDCFEWDDSVAGEKWRHHQARKLIKTVYMSIRVDRALLETVTYIRDPDAKHNEPGYTRVLTVRDDRARALAALRTEFGRVTAALERVRGVAAVLGLSAELADLEERALRMLEDAA